MGEDPCQASLTSDQARAVCRAIFVKMCDQLKVCLSETQLYIPSLSFSIPDEDVWLEEPIQ